MDEFERDFVIELTWIEGLSKKKRQLWVDIDPYSLVDSGIRYHIDTVFSTKPVNSNIIDQRMESSI